MRLGLIARADSRGLGIQLKAFHDQMNPERVMVIDCPSAQPLPIRKHWYPDATWVHGLPSHDDFHSWFDGLTHVYTAETGYGTALWHVAARRGVKTVLHANWEFLNKADRPTLWAAPSVWNYSEFPTPRTHLPVPIETERFPVRRWPTFATAKQFLCVVGRPTWNGRQDLHRNGTVDVIQALTYVKADVEVHFRCQAPGYVENLLQGAAIPPNVTVHVDAQDAEHYWTAYEGMDTLLLPRRFGGLSLPLNEALGAGIPTLMTDIEPNRSWLPKAWLTPARWVDSFVAKQRVDCFQVDHEAYARSIDRLATSPRAFADARMEAQRLAGENSWHQLKPLYQQTFEEL